MREGIFELRTLTSEEEKDVKHIVYATHTSWQIMFGLIAEDMLSVKEKQLKVSYKELVEKGHTILWGTFEAWTFEYYDQELIDSEGIFLQEHPQMLMRFIVTALEMFGFKRIKKSGENQYIDTSAIAYEDFW